MIDIFSKVYKLLSVLSRYALMVSQRVFDTCSSRHTNITFLFASVKLLTYFEMLSETRRRISFVVLQRRPHIGCSENVTGGLPI